jgi:membrane-associated phospholipid phosphatase
MKKTFAGFRFYEVLTVLSVAVILIIVGSFFDLAISKAIAVTDNNYFGLVFGLIGKLPSYAIFGASGVLLFIYLKDENGLFPRTVAWLSLFLCPIVAGALYGYDDVHDQIASLAVAIAIGILLVGALDAGAFFLFREAPKEEAFKAAVAFFFAFAAIFVLTYLLKIAGMRPRYSWLVDNGFGNYRDWWAFDSSVADANSAASASSFESWPSSHAALASVTLLSILFPRLCPKLNGKEKIFFVAAFVYTLLVMMARVSDGSHFVSDVGWGLFIGAGISLLVVYLVYDVPLPAKKNPEVGQ